MVPTGGHTGELTRLGVRTHVRLPGIELTMVNLVIEGRTLDGKKISRVFGTFLEENNKNYGK